MSTLRLNQTVCLVAMAFLHYGRGGNAGFQHADKSIRAIFDQSEHIKLTHVSSAIALFLFVSIRLFITL